MGLESDCLRSRWYDTDSICVSTFRKPEGLEGYH